ncbi:hypothetical protein HOD30_00925 [Candidatus Peregrinibacteria bacterium]|mgnify:CR=1 FL=1|jgi:O-antigen ligase|nr:hypothetical protein [Candidatus Peregrinibacteria bacterium]MBT4631896.1 hypothetical protein [Candidatus Peregrinibacteria bacterium]MBT5516558.1 hypothetical protein [Candidatus Peregrinibacteria bacterium]MBT5824183.1 hypothetical protein [Candidatus Peregrinibacteria bacterium]
MSVLNKWMQILFGIAIFTLPFQVHVLAYQTTWGRGFTNPYGSIYFTITEFFLLGAGLLFLASRIKTRKRIKIGDAGFFLLMLSIAFLTTLSLYLSPFEDYTFHLFLFLKISNLILFYTLIVNKVLRANEILKIFIFSMCFQAALAIFQLITQSSLGLGMLGEPYLADNVAHLARFTLNDSSIIRSYGTFSHPNILGGFLVTSLLSTLLFSPKHKNERSILLLIQFLGILATFSRSAIFALTVALVFIYIWYLKEIKNNKIIPISLGSILLIEMFYLAFSRGFDLLNDPAFIERINGYKQAIEIFEINQLGVGYSHFTLFLDQISQTPLMPWEYQPVHNLFLLALSEAGVIGMIGIVLSMSYIFYRIFHNRKIFLTRSQNFKKRILFVTFLSLFLISMLDHYTASLDQGRFLVVLVFAIASSFNANPRQVLPIKRGASLKKILSGRG